METKKIFRRVNSVFFIYPDLRFNNKYAMLLKNFAERLERYIRRVFDRGISLDYLNLYDETALTNLPVLGNKAVIPNNENSEGFLRENHSDVINSIS